MEEQGKIKVTDLIAKFRDPVWEERKRASDLLAKVGSRVVPYLVEALKQENEDTRYWAIRTLGEIASPDALKAIFMILEGADRKYKLYAIQALKFSRQESIVKKLIELLSSDDWDIISASANSLENIGKLALPHLLNALKTGDENVKFWCVKIISKIDINILVKFAQHSNRDIRLFTTEALGDIPDISSVKILLHFLRDSYWEVRQNAVDSLVKLGDIVIKPLLHFLSGKDMETYLWGMKVLERIKVSKLSPLLEELKCGKRDVRVNIVRILGNTFDERVISPLFEVLMDNSVFVAKAAANALTNLASKEELKEKIVYHCSQEVKNLKNPSNYRYWCMMILAKIGDEVVNNLLEGLRVDPKEVKLQVVKVIGELKLESGVDKLIELLDDEHWPVRKEAAQALINFGSKIALYIYPYLLNGTENVKEWTQRIIKEVGHESVDEFMEIVQNSEDRDQKLAAILALGLTGNEKAFDYLQEIVLHEKDDWIRKYALEGLIKSGFKGVNQFLLKLLHDKSEAVLASAVEYLCKQNDSELKEKLLGELESLGEDREKYVYLILASMGEEDSFLPLAEEIKREDENSLFFQVFKNISIKFISKILPYLVESFKEKDWGIRDKIHKLLIEMGKGILQDLKNLEGNAEDQTIKFWIVKTIKHIEEGDKKKLKGRLPRR